jgi:diguanylate cyclase (GGDEF)-like protein
MRVLIAEDEPIPAHLLRRMLEAMGHEVQTASDGLQAWRLFQAEHPPVVISDWVMPELDGPGLCRRVRAVAGNSYTYFILLTAKGGRGDRMEGLRAGADDFLTKPLDAEELAVRLEIARRILDIQARLEHQNARLAEMATTDDLTGLKNRREFLRALEMAQALASRQGLPLSLIMLDVDHFKSYNDTFGHTAGDDALRAVGAVLRECCREHETIARYGGEEFVAILLGAGAEEARLAAERLREAVTRRSWRHRPLTVSCGVATAVPPMQGNPKTWIDHADMALYLSKRRGRNCVTHYDDPPGPSVGLPVAVPAPGPLLSFLADDDSDGSPL